MHWTWYIGDAPPTYHIDAPPTYHIAANAATSYYKLRYPKAYRRTHEYMQHVASYIAIYQSQK